MKTQYGIFDTMFAKIGWVKSIDSNGFEICSIPEGTILNKKPTSWDRSAMDDRVFIDEISFGEDIHLGTLDCISPFLPGMIKNRSTFIIFPKNTPITVMIDSIIETFPEKYTKEQLISKRFVSSNGNRYNR
jgi:hypothetical protein